MFTINRANIESEYSKSADRAHGWSASNAATNQCWYTRHRKCDPTWTNGSFAHRYLCARSGERNIVALNERAHLRGDWPA